MLLEDYLKYTKENNGCREWQRCFNSDGYPRAASKTNSNLKVHREVFFLVNGYYPPVVRHSCDNIKCIEPSHLLAGTNLDNVADRHERGRTYHHMSDELKKNVRYMREHGASFKKIMEAFGLGFKQVEYILRNSRKVG